MTLFGRTFDGQEIAALVFMLTALVFWIFVYRGERSWARWFRRWEADRKGRREAGLAGEQGADGPPSAPGRRRGPWG